MADTIDASPLTHAALRLAASHHAEIVKLTQAIETEAMCIAQLLRGRPITCRAYPRLICIVKEIRVVSGAVEIYGKVPGARGKKLLARSLDQIVVAPDRRV